MRQALLLLSVCGAAAFGGIEYLLNGGNYDQNPQPWASGWQMPASQGVGPNAGGIPGTTGAGVPQGAAVPVSGAYQVHTRTERPHTYDSNGHFIGSYPKDMLINSHTAPGILGGCSNTCTGSVNTPRQDTNHEHNGNCDDGGPGSEFDLCEYGTDCADCGPRHGQMHTHSVEITPSTGRRMSAEDTEDALLEAAKAGAHESVDSSALEDSLPAMMTEI